MPEPKLNKEVLVDILVQMEELIELPRASKTDLVKAWKQTTRKKLEVPLTQFRSWKEQIAEEQRLLRLLIKIVG